MGDELPEPRAAPAGEAGRGFLVARLAAAVDHGPAGREPDLVAELRSFHRPAARGQEAALVPSLGRAGKSSLPDWIFRRHDFGVGLARVPAVVYGDGCQRRLRILES